MEKNELIASFQVNHLELLPGLYLSRQDEENGLAVTTYDIRMTAPNREPVLDVPAIHTIEHLGATFLRNSSYSKQVVYFGPMGCRTGFYLILFGRKTPEEVFPMVREMFDFIAGFEGDIPGAKPAECGNYAMQDLPMAKFYAKAYLAATEKPRFVYPE